MTAMTPISPERAVEPMREGAILVDIRERDEYARERSEGARHHPVSILDREHPACPGDQVLVFPCRSGARTTQNAQRIGNGTPADVETDILDGGVDAWKKAGLPVTIDRKAPIPVMRRIQLAAGSFAVLGAAT